MYSNSFDENKYYKTEHDHGMYSVAREQFFDYLRREGTIIEDYWTGDEYRCFFRRNKDTNQTNSNVSFFYPVSEGIRPGSIIKHYDETYLVLNKETVENKAYNRSDAINADVLLSTFNSQTGEEINLPCFAYDLTSNIPTQADSHMFLEINGNVELITGDNEETRKLRINYEFNAMGNWYSIVSINYKTGIARIVASVIAAPHNQPERSLSIDTSESYIQGTEMNLQANALFGEQPVYNARLKWTSSDPEVVSVTNDGHASFVSEGSCYINCTWIEHNIKANAFVRVVVEPTELVCAITGRDSIASPGSATYTATFYLAEGYTEDTTIAPVWSLSVPDELKSLVSISAQSGNTVTIRVGNGAYGKSIGLELTDEDGLYHAVKTISLMSWI